MQDALGEGGIQALVPAVGAKIDLFQQLVRPGRKASDQLAVGVVTLQPAFAEQLKIQLPAADRGVAQNKALLPGQAPKFQIGIFAAGVQQLDGEQQLGTGVLGRHGVVQGIKVTGGIHRVFLLAIAVQQNVVQEMKKRHRLPCTTGLV